MAVGEVSENPSSSAVARPTVTETRDEDIERKLRIYGIFNAFSNGILVQARAADMLGKFPSNEQIDVALTGAVQSEKLTSPSQQLSPEGRELVKDLRDVIDSLKYFWLKKNYNEELQNFLYHTIQASTSPDASNINAPVSKDQAQEHGQQALQGLRTLGRLLVTNGQFRKLLEDVTLLVRDMAADAASNATQRIRPDKERLGKIDEPAPDHTWHEAPPSIGQIKNQFRDKVSSPQDGKDDGVGRAKQETQSVAHDHSQDTTGQSDYEETGRRAVDEHVKDRSRIDVDQKAGQQAGVQSAKDRVSDLSDSIPDEHKDRAREVGQTAKSQTKDYLNRKVSQERRDQTIYRLKKMVTEIQHHEDYLEAVDTLISLAEEYVGHTKSVALDTHREAKRTVSDSNLQKAQTELKTLLENFADGASMDDMLDAADALISDANNDPEFSRWAKHLDQFIRKCLLQQGYILEDESTEEWNKLQDQGQYFLNDRYKKHTDRLNDEITRWFNYMGNDPDSVAFGSKVQKLFIDLGQDENGNVHFKRHLLSDVTDVIIPGFFENLRYVPVRFPKEALLMIDPPN